MTKPYLSKHQHFPCSCLVFLRLHRKLLKMLPKKLATVGRT